MCVTRFAHIPPALRTEPIDVVLCDHHGWGGIPACQALADHVRCHPLAAQPTQ